jgi:hypothetical protein
VINQDEQFGTCAAGVEFDMSLFKAIRIDQLSRRAGATIRMGIRTVRTVRFFTSLHGLHVRRPFSAMDVGGVEIY